MEQPIVETAEGKVRGCVRKNLDGEEFYGFLGIPYIKPPLGDLRFKAPQPPEPWTGIKDATKEGRPIYQRFILTNSLIGSEDGVSLNVFTKKATPKVNNPVMVYIHGGGYNEGSNSTATLGPEYLLIEDIVLVTINYRLGLLGYLAFEDPSLEVYGNAGMKDQVAALKWIKRNIGNFGGDPNNVTIFGQSAGSSSVEYLVMSPAAKGLFHRAIMQSGTVTSFWANGTRFTKNLLTFLGKENLSEKEALEYFRSLPVDELFQTLEKFCESLPGRHLGVVGPIAEDPNETEFITKHPFEILLTGNYTKVPILMGYCSNEVICLDSDIMANQGKAFADNFDLETILTMMIGIEKGSEVSNRLCNKIKEIYTTDNGEIDKYLILSDIFFIMGVIGCAKHHANTSDKPVYLYRMSLDAGLNFIKRLAKLDHLPGVSHTDDLGYLFKNDFIPAPEKGTIEDVSVRQFVKLWANFAKYGNPTPEGNDLGINWKPLGKHTDYFLDIDQKLSLHTNPEPERVQIWKEVFQMNPLMEKFL